MTTFQSGAQLDTRPPEAKAKDWTQAEVVAATANVQWTEKPQSSWRKFPIFDQDGSGSCVMQTECKELGIMRQQKDGDYVHFSVADGYQRRINKPGSGMGADDARKIARDGITLEVLAPSQNMSDAQLDAIVIEPYKRQVGAVFAVPNYLALPTADINAVASTIAATGKGVMVWFYFSYDEWTNRPTILHSDLNLYAESTCRHSVTAVDYTLQGNEKCLIIEDSWGPGSGVGGQRVITESFFKARNFYASYLVNFKFQEQPVQKPKHQFLTDLQVGMQGTEVKALQDCLKYSGDFPANADSTGIFGQITKTAVGKRQLRRGIVSSTDPGFGRAGPKTRADLNAEFA